MRSYEIIHYRATPSRVGSDYFKSNQLLLWLLSKLINYYYFAVFSKVIDYNYFQK